MEKDQQEYLNKSGMNEKKTKSENFENIIIVLNIKNNYFENTYLTAATSKMGRFGVIVNG